VLLAVALLLALFVCGPVGGLLLAHAVLDRLPARCPRCAGPTYVGGLKRKHDTIRYSCRACAHVHEPFDFGGFDWNTPWRRFLRATSIVWRLPFLGIVLFGILVMFLGMAGEIVFGMFLLAYGIGVGLQLLVRAFPQDHPANQPTAWKDYWHLAAGTLFLVLAVIGPVRGLIALGAQGVPDEAFGTVFNQLAGACGLYYGLVGFLRESLWRFAQLRLLRRIPTSAAASAAVGLVELQGTARALGDGPIISADWGVLSRGQFVWSHADVRAFDLEDASGRIRVDPGGADFALRAPWVGMLLSLFGRRRSELVLTRRVTHGIWPDRRVELRDGDPVYVIGRAEERSDAPPEATGSQRLVVRPSSDARRPESLVEHLLDPLARRPRREIQDVFFVTDCHEARARRLLRRGFVRSAAWTLALSGLSGYVLFRSL
jgi:hypothetical protein